MSPLTAFSFAVSLLFRTLAFADNHAFEALCREKGGTPRGSVCECLKEQTSSPTGKTDSPRKIDPRSESCLNRLIPQVEKPQVQVDEPPARADAILCRVDDNRRSDAKTPTFDQLSAKSACREPARFLCDPQYGSTMADGYATQAKFDEMAEEAEKDPEVKKIAGDKPCYQLESREKYMACVDKRSKILSSKIYTEERVTKVKIQFERARTAILKFLEAKKNQLHQQGRSEAESTVEKMISKVKDTEPVMGGKDNQIELNALSTQSPGAWYQKINPLSDGGSQIFIEATALYVDHNPDALYFLLLHEFGHVVDMENAVDQKNYQDSKFPFGREMACLKRKDSAGVRSNDPKCYLHEADKAQDTGGELARKAEVGLREAAKMAERWPDSPIPVIPGTDYGSPCPQPQMGEAFADWIATETFVENEIKHSSDSQPRWAWEKLTAALPFFCSGFKNRDSQVRHGDHAFDVEVLRDQAPHDTHPIWTDRIERIVGAQPLLRKAALGCSDEDIKIMKRTDQTPDREIGEIPVYCGSELY